MYTPHILNADTGNPITTTTTTASATTTIENPRHISYTSWIIDHFSHIVSGKLG